MNKKYVSVVPQESDPSTKCKSLSPLFPDGWGYAIGERWIHEYFGEKYAIGTEGYMIILRENMWEYAIGERWIHEHFEKKYVGICHWERGIHKHFEEKNMLGMGICHWGKMDT